MANRVIKDTILTSPTLAKLPIDAQLHWPRWLLMADDHGCFNADTLVIKGLAYPLAPQITNDIIDKLKKEYFQAGLLFLWSDHDERAWGYFTSWDNHHNFCNKTQVGEDGKRAKHKRRTPEPPKELLDKYLQKYKIATNKHHEEYDKPTQNQETYKITKDISGPYKTPQNDLEHGFILIPITEKSWRGDR